MSKLVSLVMSNYNSARFIDDTMQSVLHQSYPEWEFIVVDDCSSDTSRDLIDAYQDPRIKRFYLDHHEHMVYNFNYAISQARGEYIARIDNDDTWDPNKLKKQVDFMEEHPEIGACFTLVNVVDEDDRILTAAETDRVNIFNTANRSQPEWLRQFYFNGSCLCHTSVMIRSDVLKAVGEYNLALVQIQDFELWTRIAKKYPIHVIQERLVNYRWQNVGGSASAVTPAVLRRSNFEFAHVLSRYFDDLSDEMFIQAFGDDFIRKGTTDHNELLCEKAFLLLKPVFYGNYHKIAGMEKLIDLLNDKDTQVILREKFGVTQLNFYELSASPVFYEEPPAPPPPSPAPLPAAGPGWVQQFPGKVLRRLKRLLG